MNPNHVRRLKRLIKKHVETAVANGIGPHEDYQEVADNARIAELNLDAYISWLSEIYTRTGQSVKTQS